MPTMPNYDIWLLPLQKLGVCYTDNARGGHVKYCQCVGGYFNAVISSPDGKALWSLSAFVQCLHAEISADWLVNQMAAPQMTHSLFWDSVFFLGKSVHHKLHSESSMGGLDFHKGLAGLPFQLKWICCCVFDDKGSSFFSWVSVQHQEQPNISTFRLYYREKIIQGLLGFYSHCFLP